MSRILRIGCKINLYLAITGVREDGYHELETLFHPVAEPHDTLSLFPGGQGPAGPDGRPAAQVAPGLRLWCGEASLETPGNIVAKAYEAYAAATGHRPELTAHLAKGIPHGAGLGGGSADAAAMLAWLNENAGERALSPRNLADLAAKLGADVPFFLMNRPAWATGIGENLAPAEADLSGLICLVAVPQERVNTAWAYKAWDESNGSGDRKGSSAALTRDCPASMRPFCVYGAFIANGFEPVVFERFPAIRRLKERLYGLGASAACMSGSGSAVFALFRDSARAEAAASALRPTAVVFSARL